MVDDRLASQVTFLEELEKLKAVARRNVIVDRSRRESSAEHSFHLGVMVTLLAEHLPEPVDVGRAVEMALVHDVVEIDAGDTFAHDPVANEDKEAREREAAERLFGLLPPDQGGRFQALWEDLERGESPEARLVRALDRLQPVLLHGLTGGQVWEEHGVRRSQVLRRVAEIERSMPALWPLVLRRIEHAVRLGQLSPD